MGVVPDHRALLTATVAALGGEHREGQLALTDAVAPALAAKLARASTF